MYEFIREAQYTDKIAVMSDYAEGLRELLDSYNVAAKRFGLHINVGKTKVLCMGPEVIFFVDEIPLKYVDCFKYLGSFVSKDC